MPAARRRIAVVTGSRADYGLLREVMRRLRAADDVDLQVVVCGMHLAPKFGSTWRAIEADGFAISARVDFDLGEDSAAAVARSTGVGTIGFAAALPGLAPDIVVLLGDRYEIAAAAVAATILNYPIAHIHGGEITAGAFDDAFRHAITKMACLHFVAAEPYRQRVIQMGEDPACVFNVGAPGLDQASSAAGTGRQAALDSLKVAGPYLLVTLHPTTARPGADAPTAAAMLGALARIKDRAIVFTGVNADPGNGAIEGAIRDFVDAHGDRARLFTSLGSERYWLALSHADAVIGNSSSGIVEAPAVATPSVNIGERQQGRLRAASIIDCAIDEAEIFAAVRRILDGGFRPDPSVVPPYGRGGASARIADMLARIDLSRAFPKRFRDLPRG
ncbi:MAG: UDP-N-acetylglucosamine 2-epimerase (hydrolyzing) [Proteobacteria bacterium]|nr:UDP-N-acetylglucosamine 2-epimerase (hydrolyzing) [Pseudomonadota bacterium]